MLEKIAKFEEIELEDLDIDLEEIEFDIEAGSGGISSPILARLGYEFALIRDSANRMAGLLGAPTMPIPQQHQETFTRSKTLEKAKPDKLIKDETAMPSPE